MRAILLAAGLGKRMRPLTDNLPKPLLSVGGRPLIDWQLEKLASAGVSDVVINLHWLGEKIRNHVGKQRFGLQIAYSEEPELLETGGGILQALPMLGDKPFWVVNGDVWSDVELLPHQSLPASSDGKLLLIKNPEHNQSGDFSFAATVSGTAPGTASSSSAMAGTSRLVAGSGFTYSGMSLLTAALFEGCLPGKFPLKPLLDRAIDAGSLHGELIDAQWVDVGTPERLTSLDQLLTGACA